MQRHKLAILIAIAAIFDFLISQNIILVSNVKMSEVVCHKQS